MENVNIYLLQHKIIRKMTDLSNLTEDEQMAWALAASINDHQISNNELYLSTSHRKSRSSYQARAGREGTIIQHNTLDQFHITFKPLIQEFKAPGAICGYMVMAKAMLLSQHLPPQGLDSPQALDDMLQIFRNTDLLLPELRTAMAFVHNNRTSYIQAHGADFTSERDRKSYMSAWIANYEISDYLRSRQDDVKSHVNFLRFNQVPDLKNATHEERIRILDEEMPFGDVLGSLIVESFRPERRLITPDRYKQLQPGASCSPASATASPPSHAHPLVQAVNSSTHNPAWMCDHCEISGQNTHARYRCAVSCDYDLCEPCFFQLLSAETKVNKPNNSEEATQGSEIKIESAVGQNRTFVLDMNGHFIICTGHDSGQQQATLHVFNTTNSDYISNGASANIMMTAAFDACFH